MVRAVTVWSQLPGIPDWCYTTGEVLRPRGAAIGARTIVATKYQRQDIRGRTSKVSQAPVETPGAPVLRPGRRFGWVQIMALLSIISILAVVDGMQRRSRLQDEGVETAAGEVVEKRSPSTEKPASGHVLVLRLAFPEGEYVVLTTEVDPATWASLNPGDLVRVHYAPGSEVGTLDIRLIEPGPKGAPPGEATQGSLMQ